jgi:hypothetical protein
VFHIKVCVADECQDAIVLTDDESMYTLSITGPDVGQVRQLVISDTSIFHHL